MSPERKPDLHLEIAHVLFIDVVGYSKLLADEQSETLQLLNQIVRGTAEFRTSEAKSELIRLPTGDGMALVYLTKPEAPVQCALEISKAIKSYPELQLRMGIHSGSVNQVRDVNDRLNVTGAGINTAQRVMDCGDAGHILLSRRVAEDLEQYRLWQRCLHDLGECEVKHGVRVHVFNLYTDEVGNRDVPAKLKPIAQEPAAAVVTSAGESTRSRHRLIAAAVLLAIVLALGFGLWVVSHRAAPKSTTATQTPAVAESSASPPALPASTAAQTPAVAESSTSQPAPPTSTAAQTPAVGESSASPPAPPASTAAQTPHDTRPVYVVVAPKSKALNIRAEPSAKSRIIEKLQHGDQVLLEDGNIRNDNPPNPVTWQKVTAMDGVTGWTNFDYLAPSKDANPASSIESATPEIRKAKPVLSASPKGS